jgi:hypothetical protein
VAKTRRKAQLRGQQLPAKKGKVRARLVQTAQIQDWDNLTSAQQQEALNWGIDIDVDDSTDSDEDMSGQAGGSSTFTMAATGGGSTGGGGPPGGGPPAGGGGGGPPGPAGPAAPVGPPPTLDDLTRLMADVGNAVGILAQQVLDLTRAQNAGRSGTKDAIPRPKAWDGKGGSAEARHFLAAFLLRFAKRCLTWTRMMWMQPWMTQLWSSDTRYSNTRSTLYVRRRRSTSTNIDKR